MKKYLLSIAVLATMIVSSCGTLQFQKPTVQVNPVAPRAYVWDIPKTENMVYNNLLKGIPIPAYDYKGDVMFVLVSQKMYDYLEEELKKAKKLITAEDIRGGVFFGLDLAVSPMGKISLLTNEQIRQLETPEERNMAIALNDFKKYTLLGESTRPVIGSRNSEGKFIPSFNSVVSFERKTTSVPETFDGGGTATPSTSNPWLELQKKAKGN